MPHAYDATLKYLVAREPAAWLEFVGLPPIDAELVEEEEIQELLSADLSTVSASADILMRMSGDGLAHIDFQSGPDPRMDDRALHYNVLADYRFGQHVETVVVLLRKEAAHPAMSGRVDRTDRRGRKYLAFEYAIVRLWEIPVEEILNGPFGVLAAAPLAQVEASDLPGVIRRMGARIAVETPSSDATEIWTSVYVLMGLKYSDQLSKRLLQGVMGMKESATYQAILSEGEAKGELQGIRETILRLASRCFGTPTDNTVAALNQITSIPTLQVLVDRLLEVESWSELLEAVS